MGARSATGVAVALWGGLLLGAAWYGPHADLRSVACLLVAMALATLACVAPPRVGALALLAAAGAFGVARGIAAERRLDHAAAAVARVAGMREDAEPDVTWLRLRVLDHPWRESGRPGVVARVASGSARGARVRVWLPDGADVEWGDAITALVRLERPPGPRVPGGFDAAAAAHASGIVAQGRAVVARIEPGEGTWALPRATLARWRRAVEGVLARTLSPSARELVTPLVDGDRSALTPEMGGHLQASGLTHLLALSGMHVVWLAGVVRVVAAAVGAGFALRQALGAACAALYLGIAGPLPSLARAAVMEALLAVALLRGRTLDPVQALGVSTLVLLAIAPGWAHDLGFQLSCLATLGLVTIGRGLEERLAGAPGAVRTIAAALVPTLAAQALALPLLLARFHALPCTTLAANLAAVPVSGALLAAAWLGAVLELAAPGAGHLPLAACEPLAFALRAIAGAAARVPLALWPAGHEPGIAWLAALGALLLCGACAGPRDLAARRSGASPARRRAAVVGAIAAALAVVLAITARPLRPPPGAFWVVALDVGQGDAIALGFADGWWLVDTGPRTEFTDAGRRAVLPFLRWAAVRRLERLVLTHDDLDHTGGALAVREGVRVAATVSAVPVPGAPGPAHRLGAGTAGAGDTMRHAPPVVALWPPRGWRAHADNAASLVLAVGEGPQRVLLMADADSAVEVALGGNVAGPIAVLKAGHHGSASSSGLAFLRRVRPQVAVLSCGRGNVFGHPRPETLERLRAAGVPVRRTDREGTVWLEIGPGGVRAIDWRAGRDGFARPWDRW
jgi:competence protein ComEC